MSDSLDKLPIAALLHEIFTFQIRYNEVESNEEPTEIKAGSSTSFLLTGLRMNTKYMVQVESYGDKSFLDSVPAVITVETEYDGKRSFWIREVDSSLARFSRLLLILGQGQWRHLDDFV